MNRSFVKKSLVVFVFLLSFPMGEGSRIFAQTAGRPGFIFLPFEDKSDFEGKWEVGVDVPRFLNAYVNQRYRIPSVSPALVRNFLEEQKLSANSFGDVKFWIELYKRFHVRYLVAGTVEEFDVSRFMTGQPLLGGYEAFKGEVRISYVIYDMDKTAASASYVQVTKGEAAGEFADRALALTLFGKPTERTLEFRDLDKIKFGTDEFNRTVIGQACFQLGDHFSLELENALPTMKVWAATTPDSLLTLAQSLDSISISFRFRTISGSIVFIEANNVFLNLGSEDGMRAGQRVFVYAAGSEQSEQKNSEAGKVGELQVLEVRGPHLSHTRIISGEGKIKMKDKVQVTIMK